MASLRDLVSSSDVCTPSDGAGPSNAASSLVNTLLGGRSKQQQQLHELPVGQGGPSFAPAPFRPPTAAAAAQAALAGDLPAIPGLTHPSPSTAADVDAFLKSQMGPSIGRTDDLVGEFERMYGPAPPVAMAAGPAALQHAAASRSAAAPFLAAFFRAGRSPVGGPFDTTAGPPLPPGALALSVPDQCRVRDRSTILARQVFADQGAAFADQQVGRLLHSLSIDPAVLPAGAGGAAAAAPGAWDAIYAHGGPSLAGEHAAAAAAAHAAHAARAAGAADGPWVDEFSAMSLGGGGSSQAVAAAHPREAWAEEFAGGSGSATATTAAAPASWADEFAQAAEAGSSQRRRADQGTAMEQTKRLADTLAANADPKFQNSKFLQFVAKMSRGELILEDNAVKEVRPEAAAWAQEFAAQPSTSATAAAGPSLWGEEFASFQAAQHPGTRWAQEFGGNTSVDWAEQFAEGVAAGAGGDWAQEFSGNAAAWEEEYLAELERLHGAGGPRASGAYTFKDPNPFLSDLDSFQKGKELFKRGVLSEAVLALEAECQRNPGNSEAWRLLGTVQAENDDDVAAIAALERALAADPSDLDALLSLGVSHTNELDQSQALGYLRQWIMQHTVHGPAARAAPPPPDSSQAMAYVIGLYEGAAAAAPGDADVHAALGVLCNLSRRYDAAVAAFRAALALRPQDYSLWNKLGATLANSSRSNEALAAYQKALDLKPNYMRAWTNMGISLANIGDYEGSARYYVRALALNRQAAAVWGYLRTSLACAAREDLVGAADAEDLEALLKALPL